jgi:hypothetical protein
VSGIEAYDLGREDGIAEERKRITDWIKEHREGFELIEGDVFMYRDHFNSESLLEFIEQDKKN